MKINNFIEAVKKYGINKLIENGIITKPTLYGVIAGRREFGMVKARKAMRVVGVCPCCDQKVKK
jgi:hypothetical protein